MSARMRCAEWLGMLGLPRPGDISDADFSATEVTIYPDGTAAYTDGGVWVPVRREEQEAWTRLLGRIRGLAEEEVRALLDDSALGLTAEWLAERGECDWHDSDLEDELGIVSPVAIEIARREFTRAMREQAARRAAGEEETAR